jgi:hypothetical protein
MSGKFQTINRDTPYIITAIHNVEIAINALFVFIHSLVAGRFECVTCYAPLQVSTSQQGPPTSNIQQTGQGGRQVRQRRCLE